VALGVPPQHAAIELLAFARGVIVREADLAGADAVLARSGDRGVITVARRLPRRARRFAIAHELGHFDLHAGRSLLGLCTGDLASSAYAAEPLEEEASAYASEMLMPRRAFLDAMGHLRDSGDGRASWDVVKDLSETFDVSLTAAALRFVGLHAGRVAVVVLRDGVVEWSARSWRFRAALPRGMCAPLGSTARCAPVRWAPGPVAVPARAWIEDADDAACILEQAFRTPRGGTVMLLLEIVRPSP
jgi:Zn-dependent peptidase ImmA (M78 family)